MSSDEKIIATMIIEVIGRPKEYLIEAMDDILKKIDEEKGIRIAKKKINEPIGLKDQKDFFTTFAEIEIEADEIIGLTMLMFKYMPSHVEVLNSGIIGLTTDRWNVLLNELIVRLHKYDEVARILQTEKLLLENELRKLLPKKEDLEQDETEEDKK